MSMANVEEIHTRFLEESVFDQPPQVCQHELVLVVLARVVCLDQEDGWKGTLGPEYLFTQTGKQL